MREILFKAKRVDNGEWVFGYVVDDYLGQTDRFYIVGRNVETAQVIPETISQFTGLLDKKGNKIFENDIVKTDEAGWVAKVIYYTDAFICEDNMGGFSSMCNWDDFEVLGNIFDNPELLEKGGAE